MSSPPPSLPPPPLDSRDSRYPRFSVKVRKEDFKFNASHFVAYDQFRERLHGHNYRVGIYLEGSTIGQTDGYVLDYGVVKQAVRAIGKEMNERVIVPMKSDVTRVSEVDVPLPVVAPSDGVSPPPSYPHVMLSCQDGSVFLFPKSDALCLPISHSTTEELALYLYGRFVQRVGAAFLTSRGIDTVGVTVAEAEGQESEVVMKVDPDFDLGRWEDGGFDGYVRANEGVVKGCERNIFFRREGEGGCDKCGKGGAKASSV